MNIKKLIKDFLSIFHTYRGSGTSTLLKKIALENDVWVVVPTAEQAEAFGERGVTFEQIKSGKLLGADPKPILIDNFTMIQLLDQVEDQFIDDENKIQERNQLIANIKRQIISFEHGVPIRQDYRNFIRPRTSERII